MPVQSRSPPPSSRGDPTTCRWAFVRRSRTSEVRRAGPRNEQGRGRASVPRSGRRSDPR
jgi:hypothetical protein